MKFSALISHSVLASALLMTLAACSAKVSGGDGSPDQPQPEAFADKVTGLNLDGSYTSACLPDDFDENASKIYKMTITGRHFERNVQNYSDASCKTAGKLEHSTGVFRFSKKNAGDIYEVEYHIDAGSGAYFIVPEMLKLAGNHLLISDHRSGDGVVPDIDMLRDGATSSGSTTPASGGNASPLNPPTNSVKPAPVKDFSPGYGDTAAYEGSDGSSALYTNQGLDVSAYDEGYTEYTVYSEINEIPQGYTQYYESEMWSTSKYNDMMSTCANKETIVTKAGSFVTCKKDEGSNWVWYGNVPLFGIVKKVSKSAGTTTTLVSFAVGQ